MVKSLPAMQETQVLSFCWEDPLEEEMATHSSIFAWKTPEIKRNLVGYSPWGCKELETAEATQHFHTAAVLEPRGAARGSVGIASLGYWLPGLWTTRLCLLSKFG